MATYAELMDLVGDALFQKRLRYAVLRAAYDISNEAATTPNHVDRLYWATQLLTGQAYVAIDRLAIGVLLNPAIAAAGASTSDADIQYQVNAMVPGLV